MVPALVEARLQLPVPLASVFFNPTPTPAIYTLSPLGALPVEATLAATV